MNFPALIRYLETRVAEPLPGWKAQGELVPNDEPQPFPPPHHKPSSTLTLVYPYEGQAFVVFMRRTHNGSAHSGEMSFPGGKIEPGDPSPEHAALREAWEELGIHPDEVKVIGRLSDLYIPGSNYLVKPVLGFSRRRPQFQLSSLEVAELVEIPLKSLLYAVPTLVPVRKTADGNELVARAYFVEGHAIWGATAMILNEMLSMLKESLSTIVRQ